MIIKLPKNIHITLHTIHSMHYTVNHKYQSSVFKRQEEGKYYSGDCFEIIKGWGHLEVYTARYKTIQHYSPFFATGILFTWILKCMLYIGYSHSYLNNEYICRVSWITDLIIEIIELTIIWLWCQKYIGTIVNNIKTELSNNLIESFPSILIQKIIKEKIHQN